MSDTMNDAVCIEVGCNEPATHERLIDVVAVDCVGDGDPFTETVELVCEDHQ